MGHGQKLRTNFGSSEPDSTFPLVTELHHRSSVFFQAVHLTTGIVVQPGFAVEKVWRITSKEAEGVIYFKQKMRDHSSAIRHYIFPRTRISIWHTSLCGYHFN